jgi:hypothetical protein
MIFVGRESRYFSVSLAWSALMFHLKRFEGKSDMKPEGNLFHQETLKVSPFVLVYF